MGKTFGKPIITKRRGAGGVIAFKLAFAGWWHVDIRVMANMERVASSFLVYQNFLCADLARRLIRDPILCLLCPVTYIGVIIRHAGVLVKQAEHAATFRF